MVTNAIFDHLIADEDCAIQWKVSLTKIFSDLVTRTILRLIIYMFYAVLWLTLRKIWAPLIVASE